MKSLIEKDARFNSGYYEAYKSASRLRKKGDKPYLYAYWARHLRSLKPGGRLLDIGCGLGFFLEKMQDVYEAYGVDISGYAVKEAKRTAVRSRIQECSAMELAFEESFFDVITAFDIIEHLEKPALFFGGIQKILKKNGLLVISTPNLDSFGARIKAKDKWAGFKDPTHVTLLPSAEWRNLIEKNGFAVLRDGTDFLWDTPYFKYVPDRLQWLFFTGLTWALVWANGVYPWRFGENYVCVARKV